jgi:hypothetical protein
MIANSVLNPIFFKLVPTSNPYPDFWNTLHNDLQQGNSRIIPYFQKFNSNHVVYLQFESDLADSIGLKAYNYLTGAEIESFTGAYHVPYRGTAPDIRYYTNFVITLDADYIGKQVYFKATQLTTVMTSEPIITSDLTEKLQAGTMKYIKYTNLDRIEADLDDRFVDWEALGSTGNYMDFFIEGVMSKPNSKDESEILEGSQSKTVLSSRNYWGRILETGPVPDYMATRLALASSLDVFMVGKNEYVKEGGADQDPFGGSTLYQVSMKLTQKLAIGINVDNVGISSGSITPPVSGTTMYVGSVTSAAPNETEVKTITPIAAVKEDHTVSLTGTGIRPCHAAPTAFGALTSILDAVGDEIISGFAVITLDFTIGASTVNFTIYTLMFPVTLAGSNITFKYS